MAKTIQAIQRQIDKLQREADALRSKEVVGVVERIRSAIQHYQLSADDLFGGRTAKRGGKSSTTSARAPSASRGGKGRPVAVKFRDDEGNTWTGRGSQPRWLTAHLKAGRKADEFRVSPQ